MSASRTKVKSDATETTTNGGRSASRYYRPRSARRVMLDGIVLALAAGPATAEQICERLGFVYASEKQSKRGNGLHSLLLIQERKQVIKRVGFLRLPGQHGPGARQILWALSSQEPRS